MDDKQNNQTADYAKETASNLSAILQETTRALLDKEKHHFSWLISTGMIVNSCGLLFLYLLLWMHMREPGHREGYAGMRANEKRLEHHESELSQVNKVLEKAEYTEANVKLIRAELADIKARLLKGE